MCLSPRGHSHSLPHVFTERRGGAWLGGTGSLPHFLIPEKKENKQGNVGMFQDRSNLGRGQIAVRDLSPEDGRR